MDAQLGIDTDKWSLILRGDNSLDENYQTFTFGGTGPDDATLYRRVNPEYYSLVFSWRLR